MNIDIPDWIINTLAAVGVLTTIFAGVCWLVVVLDKWQKKGRLK